MNKKWKQKLHLEPPIGWMNDPNGLCWFKNKCHVYFQYAPDDMGMPDSYTNPTAELGWQHCLTLPRELSLAEDGAIMQRPISELETFRGGSISVPDGVREMFHLPFELSAAITQPFQLRVGSLTMQYTGEIFSICFDENTGYGRNMRKVKVKSCRDLRIIADTSSLEIYLDGGRYVMSTRFYPSGEDVILKSNGINAIIYPLKGMEMNINGK